MYIYVQYSLEKEIHICANTMENDRLERTQHAAVRMHLLTRARHASYASAAHMRTETRAVSQTPCTQPALLRGPPAAITQHWQHIASNSLAYCFKIQACSAIVSVA